MVTLSSKLSSGSSAPHPSCPKEATSGSSMLTRASKTSSSCCNRVSQLPGSVSVSRLRSNQLTFQAVFFWSLEILSAGTTMPSLTPPWLLDLLPILWGRRGSRHRDRRYQIPPHGLQRGRWGTYPRILPMTTPIVESKFLCQGSDLFGCQELEKDTSVCR